MQMISEKPHLDAIPSNTRPRRLQALAAALVAAAFLLMLTLTLAFVAKNALNLPFYDEWSNVPVIAGEAPLTWHWLWMPHNEHRILLPRLLYLAVAALSHDDFRAGCYVNVALLAAASLALLYAIRQARGRWSLTDAFFPLILLTPAHFEDLLSGFQSAFLLPVALLAATLALVVIPGPFTPRRLTLLSLGLAALPLCAAGGLIFAAAMTAWLVLAAVLQWRQGGGRFLLAALPVALVIAACSLGLSPTLSTSNLHETLHGLAQCLSTAFGPPTLTHWPWHARLTKCLLAATTFLLLWIILRHPHQRLRATALLALLAGTFLVALAIGYGRTTSGQYWAMAPRYAAWMALIPICSFYAWTLYGLSISRWLIPTFLLLAPILMLPTTLTQARDFAQSRHEVRDAIVTGAKAGRPAQALGTRYADQLWLFDDTAHVIPASGPDALAMLARHHLGPFKKIPAAPSPDLSALHPTDLPLTPASTNQIELLAPSLYHGTGTDPYLVFHLDHPQYVVAIRLTFTLDNSAHNNPTFQCFWMDPPRQNFSYDRSFTQILPPGPRELTLYPCEQISELRLDPDIQPCTFHLTRITLLTPSAPSETRP